MSTGCDRYEDGLVAYAAGTLAPDRRAWLEAHLEECGACRDELAVSAALRAAAPVPPPGLEARIQRAVRDAAAGAVPVAAPVAAPAPPVRARPGGWRVRGAWRPLALPLAAAAVLAAVWVGVESPWTDGGEGEPEALEALAAEGYHPYGTLPAGDGVVAGEPLLSELSVEDLERLLEEMR